MTDFARKTRNQDLTLESVKAQLNSPPLNLDVDALDIAIIFAPQSDPTKAELLEIDTVLTPVQINQVLALFPELEVVP